MGSVEIASLLVPLLTRKKISNKDVEGLQQKLQKIQRFDGPLLENLILPRFFVILEQNITTRSEDEQMGINVLRILTSLIEKSTITNEMAFKAVLVVLVTKMQDQSTGKLNNISEKLKKEIFTCMGAFCRSLASETVETLYTREKMKIVTQVAFLSSSALDDKGESDLELKLAALRCLSAVLQLHVDEDDIVLREQIAGVVFVITPQIFGKLFWLTVGESIVPLQLRKEALQVLERLILLLFHNKVDFENREVTSSDVLNLLQKSSISSDSDVLGLKNRSGEEKQKYMESVEKSDEWTQAAAGKIKPHLSKLSSLLAVPGIESELQMLSLTMVRKCSQYFQDVLVIFYEILLILGEDLVVFEPTILREGFQVHLNRLPRLIHRQNETELAIGIRLLTGYLRCLSENDPFVVESLHSVEILMDVLVTMLEVQLPVEMLNENVEWIHPEDPFEVKLKHVEGPSFDGLFQVLQKPRLRESLYRSALELLDCNEILVLLIKLEVDNKELLELLLDPRHWHLQIRAGNEAPVEELRFNIMHICLTLQLVAHLATEGVAFFKVLPKMMEKAGSSNCLVHHAAVWSLHSIAQKQLIPLEQLVSQNSDFISHFVAMRLRKGGREESLKVLNAFLELNRDAENSFVRTLLGELTELLPNYRSGDEALPLVLKIILIALRKFPDRPLVQVPETVEPANLEKKWLDILEPPSIDDFPASEEADENEENPENVDEPLESSSNSFIRRIVRSCFDFMNTSHVPSKLYALDIMTRSLAILEDNKEFLPTVHLIWGPLPGRFKESNLLVVNRTFDLLLVMAERAKDFIQKRTTTDVLPLIVRTIRGSLRENLENTGSFASTLTQSHKLQMRIFENMGRIIGLLEVHEKDLDDVLEATLPIFTTKQPRVIQLAALSLLRHLHQYDPTAVIVKFLHLTPALLSISSEARVT